MLIFFILMAQNKPTEVTRMQATPQLRKERILTSCRRESRILKKGRDRQAPKEGVLKLGGGEAARGWVQNVPKWRCLEKISWKLHDLKIFRDMGERERRKGTGLQGFAGFTAANTLVRIHSLFFKQCCFGFPAKISWFCSHFETHLNAIWNSLQCLRGDSQLCHRDLLTLCCFKVK